MLGSSVGMTLSLFLLALATAGQKPDGAAASATETQYFSQAGIFRQCAFAAVDELAPGPGSVQDIAQTALVRCGRELQALRDAYDAAVSAAGASADTSTWRDNVATIRRELESRASRNRIGQP